MPDQLISGSRETNDPEDVIHRVHRADLGRDQPALLFGEIEYLAWQNSQAVPYLSPFLRRFWWLCNHPNLRFGFGHAAER